MLPAKIILAFHFMWFDWHDMVTKAPVPSSLGITNVPLPTFAAFYKTCALAYSRCFQSTR